MPQWDCLEDQRGALLIGCTIPFRDMSQDKVKRFREEEMRSKGEV